MVGTAAHLVEHVLPPLTLRQWVLSVPKRLRYFLHDDAAMQGVVVRILLRHRALLMRTESRLHPRGPAEGGGFHPPFRLVAQRAPAFWFRPLRLTSIRPTLACTETSFSLLHPRRGLRTCRRQGRGGGGGVITEPAAVRQILGHLGEPTRSPVPARGPRLWEAVTAAPPADNAPHWDELAQPLPPIEFDQRLTW